MSLPSHSGLYRVIHTLPPHRYVPKESGGAQRACPLKITGRRSKSSTGSTFIFTAEFTLFKGYLDQTMATYFLFSSWVASIGK